MSYEINDALNIKLNTALNTSVFKNVGQCQMLHWKSC